MERKESSSLISIIMPVYNSEKRLLLSINSILNQTYKNIELILINDGSKDKSAEICNDIANKDSRVTVVHQKNSGVSVSRNIGVALAKGEYITFVDSDDTLENDTYEVVLNELIYNDADMAIFGMSFDYYQFDTLIRKKEMTIKKDSVIYSDMLKEYFLSLYDKNYLSSVCNKVIKTSLIKNNQIKFERKMAILEDLKFVLDVLEYAKIITVLKDSYYKYYNDLTLSSLSRRPNIDYMSNFKILDFKLRDLTKKINLNDKESEQKINAMIFRFYMIGIEKVYSSNLENKLKRNELKRYIDEPKIKKAANLAVCNGKRLKLIHWIFKNEFVTILDSIFLFNNKIQMLKRKKRFNNVDCKIKLDK